jgi:hypothetical protein
MKPFAEDIERLWFLIRKFGRGRGCWYWGAFEGNGVEVGVEERDLGAELAFGEFEVDFVRADEDDDFFGESTFNSGVC